MEVDRRLEVPSFRREISQPGLHGRDRQWTVGGREEIGAILEDILTWTDRTVSGLRAYTAPDGNRWIEQNPKLTSGWAKLARKGHQIAWEFGSSRADGYTGRVMIDGKTMTNAQAIEALWGAR